MQNVFLCLLRLQHASDDDIRIFKKELVIVFNGRSLTAISAWHLSHVRYHIVAVNIAIRLRFVVHSFIGL